MAALLDKEDIARLSRPQSRLATDYRPADVGNGIGNGVAHGNQEDTWRASEHATSALLSQLDALQPPLRAATAPPPRLNDGSFQHHLDIRLDEDYERFYQAQLASGNKKVPPPLEGRTLYNDMPGFDSSELEQILGGGGYDEASKQGANASLSILQSLSRMNVDGGHGGHGSHGSSGNLVEGRTRVGLYERTSPAMGGAPQSGSYPNLSSLNPANQGNVMHGLNSNRSASRQGDGISQHQRQQGPPGMHGHAHDQQDHPTRDHMSPGGQYYQSDPQYQAAFQAAYQAALMSQQQMLAQSQQYHGGVGQAPMPYGNMMNMPAMPGSIPQHLQAAMMQNALNALNVQAMQSMSHPHAQAAAAAAAAMSMMGQTQTQSLHQNHGLGHGGARQAGHGDRPRNMRQSGGPRGDRNDFSGHRVNSGNGMNNKLQRGNRNSRSAGRLGSLSNVGSSGRLTDLSLGASVSDTSSEHGQEDGGSYGKSINGIIGGAKYERLEDIKGKVSEVAQDQAGCRFLQKKFDEGGPASIEVVFDEIIENILGLMMDPFGNYLIQKMLDRCSEEQRLAVLKATSANDGLISASLNTHGTRAVQKLVETLSTREQTTLVVESLSPGVVKLIRDLNGNHVIQRCLQRLSPAESQFIYDAASENCLDVATHRHGCCVLQRCIDHSTASQRKLIISKVSVHSLPLSQDPFGNYVVQYILELGQTESSTMVMQHLKGHYAALAVQKFASNVVEKCLKLGGSGLNKAREEVVKELMVADNLAQLLQDPYANYVMQSALSVTSGQVHSDLVDKITPHVPTLRGSTHGKRILLKIQSTS